MKKSKVLPYVIFGVPVLIGLFFVYKYIKGNRKGVDAPANLPPDIDSKTETKTTNGKTTTTPAIAKYFPLKKGSKGAKVREMQQAILKYDDAILGKYRDDGDFGGGTEKAVQTILGKTSVDSQEDIALILKKASSKVADAETNAKLKSLAQQRGELAVKLNNTLANDKSLDFRAINDTAVSEYEFTTDGREKSKRTIVYKKDRKIETNGYTKIDFDNGGFMKLHIGSKAYGFSPFGVELV